MLAEGTRVHHKLVNRYGTVMTSERHAFYVKVKLDGAKKAYKYRHSDLSEVVEKKPS